MKKITTYELLKKFCDHLRHLRQERGLTQAQVAEMCGLSVVYYSRLECNERANVSLLTLIKIANGLKINISDLITKDLMTHVKKRT